MDPESVAKAFVGHYYSTFDGNRPALANLYQEGSMLTFEGQKIQGAQNIVAKLTSLPFQHCHHAISTVDSQPSGVNGGTIVFVSGNLSLAGENHSLKFSQHLGSFKTELVSTMPMIVMLSSFTDESASFPSHKAPMELHNNYTRSFNFDEFSISISRCSICCRHLREAIMC